MDSFDNNVSQEPIYGYDSRKSNAIDNDDNSILTRVFGWMAVGLGISAISALAAFKLFGIYMYLPIVYIILLVAEIALVVILSSRITKMSANAAKGCFIGYSIVNGLTLSVLFFVYTTISIYTTFFIAASMFAVAAIYGKLTKRDLSGARTYLVMALWGLIIGGLVNLFMQNDFLDYIVSGLGILVFIGLTAYDVNRIKDLAVEEGFNETTQKIAIWGALTLYLDFINLFVRLLKFFGKRNN